MDSIDVQFAITAFLSGAAGAYLVRRAWRAVRGKAISGCGSCSACPSSKPTLVNIESKRP